MSKRKSKESRTCPSYMVKDKMRYAPVTDDIMLDMARKKLSRGAMLFYVLCQTHSKTQEQQQYLFRALKDYFRRSQEIEEVQMTDQQIGAMVHTNTIKKSCVGEPSPIFVFSTEHLKKYGIDKHTATTWKKALIDGGYLKIFREARSREERELPTIYMFSDDWKDKEL